MPSSEFLAAYNDVNDPVKNSKNGHFQNTYADLKAVTDNVKNTLKEHGMIITQTFNGDQLVTAVYSDAGLELESSLKLPVDTVSDNKGWQALGSGITYCRRYAILSMFCLVAVDEDDDAEQAETTWGRQEYEPRGKEKVREAGGGSL